MSCKNPRKRVVENREEQLQWSADAKWLHYSCRRKSSDILARKEDLQCRTPNMMCHLWADFAEIFSVTRKGKILQAISFSILKHPARSKTKLFLKLCNATKGPIRVSSGNWKWESWTSQKSKGTSQCWIQTAMFIWYRRKSSKEGRKRTVTSPERYSQTSVSSALGNTDGRWPTYS